MLNGMPACILFLLSGITNDPSPATLSSGP